MVLTDVNLRTMTNQHPFIPGNPPSPRDGLDSAKNFKSLKCSQKKKK